MRNLILLIFIGIYLTVVPGCKTLEKTTLNVNVNLNITVPVDHKP